VGFLLQALSPIVPFMYLDSISDGILKGLDQQVFSFRTAIFDSAIRIILVMILLPKFGLWGFIGIMYFSNFLTCFLNVGRLLKVSRAEFKVMQEIIIPILCAFVVTIFANFLILSFPLNYDLIYIILLCAVSVVLYTVLLFISGTFEKQEIVKFFK